MTNDYKEKLLKYLTGTLGKENGDNSPQFQEFETTQNNLYSTLMTELNSDRVEVVGYLRNNDLFLIYGNGFTVGAGQVIITPFIALLDNDFNIIQLITDFDSGTSFKQFCYLNIDEEGRLYGVDCDDDYTNYRFILLNNVFKSGAVSGTYYVRLRNSYFFPAGYSDDVYYSSNLQLNNVQFLQKDKTSAKYLFVGRTKSNNYLVVTSVQINVGSNNEWNTYRFNNYANLNNNAISIVVDWETSESNQIYNKIDFYGTDVNYLHLQLQNSNLSVISNIAIASNISIHGTVFLNNNVYCIGSSYTENQNIYTYTIYLYKVLSNFFLELDTKVIETSEASSYSLSSTVYSVGSLIFLEANYLDGSTRKIKIGLVDNERLFLSDSNNYSSPGQTGFYWFSITNVFNLYEIIYQSANNISKSLLIFNTNNYNGLPYENINCILPHSGILYNNNKPIFARNLYNKTILGSTTTSTLQIPNNNLNDITISQSSLMSETNIPIIEDNTEITKNVYETVNINFLSNIIVSNENDGQILNPNASIRLNNSTSQTLDYNDAYAGKIRANYSDGTNMIITLNPNENINFITDTKAEYDFIIYVSKEVDTIEIISMDENTSYQTISDLNLEIGKVYQITQEVEIL